MAGKARKMTAAVAAKYVAGYEFAKHEMEAFGDAEAYERYSTVHSIGKPAAWIDGFRDAYVSKTIAYNQAIEVLK